MSRKIATQELRVGDPVATRGHDGRVGYVTKAGMCGHVNVGRCASKDCNDPVYEVHWDEPSVADMAIKVRPTDVEMMVPLSLLCDEDCASDQYAPPVEDTSVAALACGAVNLKQWTPVVLLRWLSDKDRIGQGDAKQQKPYALSGVRHVASYIPRLNQVELYVGDTRQPGLEYRFNIRTLEQLRRFGASPLIAEDGFEHTALREWARLGFPDDMPKPVVRAGPGAIGSCSFVIVNEQELRAAVRGTVFASAYVDFECSLHTTAADRRAAWDVWEKGGGRQKEIERISKDSTARQYAERVLGVPVDQLRASVRR